MEGCSQARTGVHGVKITVQMPLLEQVSYFELSCCPFEIVERATVV